MKRFFCFGFLLLIYAYCASQQNPCPQTQNKKALKNFKEAQQLYQQKKDFEKAKALLQKSIDEDPEFADAYLLSGYIAMKKRDYATMQTMIEKAVELCENIDPDAWYQLARFDYENKKYKEAEKCINKFLSFDKLNEDHAKRADTMLARTKLYLHPVPFDPKPVPGISTPEPEYLPYISPDNDIAFFTRRYDQQQKGIITTVSVEKFMYAIRTNGLFDKGRPMPYPFNQLSTGNEGGATITVDNKHLYFTVNKGGNFDIYYCDKVTTDEGLTAAEREEYHLHKQRLKEHWGEIKNMGPNVNDTKQWDSQPSVTPDGKTLYFASARDSLTGIDIYVTHKDEQGNWSKAKKLPPPINTNGNDKAPFIAADGKTLYFSSDSLQPNLGGYDIFMSKLDENGKWSTPVNIGYPINTESDETGFFVSTDGKTGYFSSNKYSAGGGYDIFYFDLYPQARPSAVYMEHGDFKANDPDSFVSATIEIKNTFTKEMTHINVDSVTGKYAFVVNLDHDLIVSVKKNDYAFQSEYVSSTDTTSNRMVKKDILLEKIDVGKSYTINDILFTTNSYEINDTIKAVLNEFSEYLKENPKLHVALHGHTDNIGSEQDNLVLSENRAKTVYQYLISTGIDKSRLSYKGFGAANPIAPNDTEERRAKNRRTVFVVTAK